MRLESAIFASLTLCLTPACFEPEEGESESGTAGATDPTTDPGSTSGDSLTSTTDPSTTGDTESAEGSTTAEPSTGDASDTDETGDMTTGTGELTWTEVAGPCGGSITNALWFDDRDNGFVGCGENADGEGLYTSIDGGANWETNFRFDEVRVNDVRRAEDGTLYGAGIHQLDGYSVFSIDESGADLEPASIYEASNSAFLAVNQAENIAVSADGQAMIDSLTGGTAAYRTAGGEFEEVPSLGEELLDDPDAGAFQVRRIVAHNNEFYSVGSLINDPARVYLPSQMPDATFHFARVELQPDTRDGELSDMHVWAPDHIIVAGFDQSERFPLIYLLDGGDGYDPESWEKIELRSSGLDYEGGVNDIHVIGDTVVAVGEKFPTSQGGFVVISDDGGRTWEDITPPGEPRTGALSAVWMFDTGEMVVGGGGGEMWVYGE